jgi:hypothetical protein
MTRLVKQFIPIFIATGTGCFVLLGYLFPDSGWADFRDLLIEWAVIVAAFAFFLGLVNIARVHGGRILRQRSSWFYSLVLLLAMLAGFTPPFLEVLQRLGILHPESPMQKRLNYIIFDCTISPLGASLAALVAFTLALAAFRLLRARRGWGLISGWLFILVVAAVLLARTPPTGLPVEIERLLAEARYWIVNVLGMAGMRGLLLGVALGTTITALRVLMGVERPHSEL